jgi:hypothetical protein
VIAQLKAIDPTNNNVERRNTMRRYSLFAIALLIVTMISAREASAQVDNQTEFTASFEFYAGNTKLPAGKYVLSSTNDDLAVWELRSSDGKVAVMLEVHDVQAPPGPAKSSVVFRKYENKAFLYQFFEVGNTSGFELNSSRPEQRAAKTGTAPTKHSLDATTSKASKKTP